MSRIPRAIPTRTSQFTNTPVPFYTRRAFTAGLICRPSVFRVLAMRCSEIKISARREKGRESERLVVGIHLRDGFPVSSIFPLTKVSINVFACAHHTRRSINVFICLSARARVRDDKSARVSGRRISLATTTIDLRSTLLAVSRSSLLIMRQHTLSSFRNIKRQKRDVA